MGRAPSSIFVSVMIHHTNQISWTCPSYDENTLCMQLIKLAFWTWIFSNQQVYQTYSKITDSFIIDIKQSFHLNYVSVYVSVYFIKIQLKCAATTVALLEFKLCFFWDHWAKGRKYGELVCYAFPNVILPGFLTPENMSSLLILWIFWCQTWKTGDLTRERIK
jgi:hypothetical protein